MIISKIRVTNFKSFKELEVELDKFNVLIGANASGKSNFIQIFQFLKDVISSGLDNAISMQGGLKYLRNINIGPSKIFSVDVVSDQKFEIPVIMKEKSPIEIEIYRTVYRFAMKFKRGRPGFEIIKDVLMYKCKFVRKLKEQKKKVKKEEFEGEIIISCVNGKLKIDLNKPAEVPIKVDDIFPPFIMEEKVAPNTLLLEAPIFLWYPFLPLRMILKNVSIYNFDPKLSKKASLITGRAELEADGSNLSIILKNILKYPTRKRKLFNLVNDLLPFVDRLDVKKLEDTSLLFKLRENYGKKQYLLAPFISDGTINITALIIALYFEKKPLTIIEEPERNIHPYLISKVVDMMKDASREKQIIVTTHNPEIVKHAGLKNILFISRDKEGFSTISRPANKEEVKTFLKNEIGIEELFVQNLLGW